VSQPTDFRDALLIWYAENGRDFYWRDRRLTPFEQLLTELLLKRTKAETVDAHGEDVLSTLTTPEDVIQMDQDELIELIKPFGLYNRRSKNINTVCTALINEFDDEIPQTREYLLEIPGIGEYIADSILCFSYGQPILVLDTNTITVAEHFFGINPPDDPRYDTEIRPVLEPLIPEDNPRAFNWAIIDIGATLRTGISPNLPAVSSD